MNLLVCARFIVRATVPVWRSFLSWSCIVFFVYVPCVQLLDKTRVPPCHKSKHVKLVSSRYRIRVNTELKLEVGIHLIYC